MILILHNIRSTFNVGSILRTADGFGVDKVIFSGYTPAYNDASKLPHERERTNRQIEKTALGAEQSVPSEVVADLPAWLESQKPPYIIYGLENNLDAESAKRKISLKTAKIDKNNAILILGEEVEGIPRDLYPYIDHFLEIPMRGQKESFNVSIACAIALYAIDCQVQN